MVGQIALRMFLGVPLVAYGGVFTFLMMIFTATVGYLNFSGIMVIPFKWHPRLAVITIVVALIHAFLGLAILFGF